jgi:hypothetical protein
VGKKKKQIKFYSLSLKILTSSKIKRFIDAPKYTATQKQQLRKHPVEYIIKNGLKQPSNGIFH